MATDFDPGGILELINLNVLMGSVGIFISSCELRFYTRTIVYGVKFGPSGSFNIEKFNRFVGDWEAVMFSGTMEQTTNTLNSFSPFIGIDEIMVYWGSLAIPPEPPITDFGPIVLPV
jgi:hypothetical protein